MKVKLIQPVQTIHIPCECGREAKFILDSTKAQSGSVIAQCFSCKEEQRVEYEIEGNVVNIDLA